LLTGRYQTRFGFEFNPTGAENTLPGIGLPVTEKTVAHQLRLAGYATGLVGKWHLGGTPPFHPQRHGFDEFFGFLHEGHFYLPPPWKGATTWLRRKTLPDGGKVMLFIGRLDQDNSQRRRQGCIDGILGREPDASRRDDPGATPKSDDGRYEILGTMTDQFDRAKAKANAEDALLRHPDVAAMVGLFEYNPPLILEALERAGRLVRPAAK
jgi:arylsulfatase A-like enzyme